MYEYFSPWTNPIYLEAQMRMDCPVDSNEQFARAYIPRQPYTGMFPLDKALKKGMLFPNLYVPYPNKSNK